MTWLATQMNRPTSLADSAERVITIDLECGSALFNARLSERRFSECL